MSQEFELEDGTKGIAGNINDITASIKEMVEKNGHTFVASFDKHGVMFVYSIGLDLLVGAEILMYGIDPKFATNMIDETVKRIQIEDAHQIKDSKKYDNLFNTGYAVKTVKITSDINEYIPVLNALSVDGKYTGEVYQLLFEDEAGVMQGEPEFALGADSVPINKIL